MSSNFQQFKAEVGRFADQEVPRKVQQVQQKIGLQALRGVVLKNPVASGRSRGNWQASLGQPKDGVLDVEGLSAQAVISREQPVVENAKPFSIIWLSNNVDYIERLETGWSQQAPNGMVSTTVTEIRTQFGRIE